MDARAGCDALDLRDITLVCQDWGGLLGLRLVGRAARSFARVVAANTVLPTGDQPCRRAFLAWRTFSQETPRVRDGRIVQRGTMTELPPEVLAAYDAPFPDETYKAARAVPGAGARAPDDPAREANRRAWEVLRQWNRPFLTAFSDGDPITRGGEALFQSSCPALQGPAAHDHSGRRALPAGGQGRGAGARGP